MLTDLPETITRQQYADRTAPVVSVEGLGKAYHIYSKPRDRLLQSLWRGRRKYYKDFWALRDVSFSVNGGETIGIIGANGSGKSTLLQIICGTQTPSCGTVRTTGRVAALLELGTGFNPEFSGRENVYLCASIYGLSQSEVDERIQDIESFADIGDFIDQPVRTYSSGMYVRLAFAVMAHVDADILIIDEALAVGDAFFTQKCMRFLRRFRETGTLLFVSHDTAAVTGLCERAIWLDHGCLRMLGKAKSVCEAYLAATIEGVQGGAAATPATSPRAEAVSGEDVRDPRYDLINGSSYRNDIQLFHFEPDAASFGLGGARVANVQLQDDAGVPLAWIVGGERVTVYIQAVLEQSLEQPILGFIVKDRLGQALFADNTYLSYADHPIETKAGDMLEARFNFQMPILPVGDYSIAVSIASGTQRSAVQHHWIHDAVIFKSMTSSVCTGLVGVPMRSIEMMVPAK